MKKLFVLLSLVFVVFATMAQERTVSVATFGRDIVSDNPYSYYKYTYSGTADRLIPTTRDTIDYVFNVSKSSPYDVSAMVTLDTIAGADTTVTIQILGRNSDKDSWNSIASGTSSAVTTDDVFTEVSNYSSYDELHTIDTTLTTSGSAFYITKVASQKVRYRNLNVRLIISGDDSVGTGIEVAQIELKTWED